MFDFWHVPYGQETAQVLQKWHFCILCQVYYRSQWHLNTFGTVYQAKNDYLKSFWDQNYARGSMFEAPSTGRKWLEDYKNDFFQYSINLTIDSSHLKKYLESFTGRKLRCQPWLTRRWDSEKELAFLFKNILRQKKNFTIFFFFSN